ncbi:MAG: hypothetical protein JRD89_09110 [Deltaproteobacteria bacterium]|nr:hypothetical protein [Deltaproteobacteria bacterium]
MDHHNGTFILTRPELNAVMAFACDDDTRPHLNCVRFDPEFAQVGATDGHSLLSCYLPGTACKKKAFSVPLGALSDARALLRRKRQVLRVTLAARSKLLLLKVHESDAHKEPLGTINSDYNAKADCSPPLSHVLEQCPKQATAHGYGVDGRLLGRLALVGKMGCAELHHLGASGESFDPIFYKGQAGSVELTVVFMPMRIE